MAKDYRGVETGAPAPPPPPAPPAPAQSMAQAGLNNTQQKYADLMMKGAGNFAANMAKNAKNSPQAPTPPQSPPPLPPLQAPMPGRNGYTPTNAPYGMDQTNPGVNEQFWNQNQNLWTKGAFGAPGQGQQFWNQIQGDYNKAGQNLQPQFDKAYDRAQEKAVGTANAQAAARGVYGSSQALNNIGNIITDSEANRANAYTDFALKNAQNQQNAASTFGGLAFGAEGLGNQQRGLDLSALNSGFSASNVAQNNRNNRIQGQFDNLFRNQGQALDFMQGQYGGLIGGDQDLYTQATNAGPAATQQALNASNDRRQQNTQDLSTALSIGGMVVGGPIGAAVGDAIGGSGGGNPGQYTPQGQPYYMPSPYYRG